MTKHLPPHYPLSLTSDMESPPRGWRLTVEQTGHTITSGFMRSLKKNVKDHMVANSIPLPEHFNEWVEDAACRESGHEGWCRDAVGKPIDDTGIRVTSEMVKRFVGTMLGVLKRREFVPMAEAQRRLDICKACPLASSVGFCHGCSSVMRTANKLLDKIPLEVEKEKSVCGACGCFLKLKALIPNETLDKSETTRPAYAEGCWRLEG